MRWLKHTTSIILLLVAAGIVLATALSDHSDDYGRVSLPQGGTVHLPEGKVTIYYRVRGDTSDQADGLTFDVTPADGGAPIAMALADGETSDLAVTRRATIGEVGALAKLDVPAAGDYLVSGSTDLEPGAARLDFGTNAGNAVLQRWKLLAGLVLGALLLALIPVSRSGRRRDSSGEPRWSSDPSAPYAP
jgi:hypothetical protein